MIAVRTLLKNVWRFRFEKLPSFGEGAARTEYWSGGKIVGTRIADRIGVESSDIRGDEGSDPERFLLI